MTVRISTSLDGAVRHISVAGRLTGAEVAELDNAVGDDLASACLELGDLRSADGAGLALLRRLRASGVRMTGTAPHLAWRIAEENG